MTLWYGPLALLLAAGTTHAHTCGTGAGASEPDCAAIRHVLDNYSKAVTDGDEALFMTTLLDDQITFFAVGDLAAQPPSLKSADTRGFAAFRRSVFHTNTRYRQTFDHVIIDQDSSLAAVQLHFVTQVVPSSKAWEGWKTLQLLKVGDQWKIVSELYTVRDQHPNADPDKKDVKTR